MHLGCRRGDYHVSGNRSLSSLPRGERVWPNIRYRVSPNPASFCRDTHWTSEAWKRPTLCKGRKRLDLRHDGGNDMANCMPPWPFTSQPCRRWRYIHCRNASQLDTQRLALVGYRQSSIICCKASNLESPERRFRRTWAGYCVTIVSSRQSLRSFLSLPLAKEAADNQTRRGFILTAICFCCVLLQKKEARPVTGVCLTKVRHPEQLLAYLSERVRH